MTKVADIDLAPANFRDFFEETRKKKASGRNGSFFLLGSEESVIRSLKQSKVLQDRFIKQNDGIAWYWARRYHNSRMKIELEDLVQEARIGMFSGIESYALQSDFRGHVFISARNGVLKALASANFMKIPSADLANHRKISEKESEIGEVMADEDIEDLLDIKPVCIRKARLAGEISQVASLDRPLEEGETSTLFEVISDERAVAPNLAVETKSLYSLVFSALASFPEKEKQFFYFQFIYGFELVEILEILKINTQEAKKMEAALLSCLRDQLGVMYAN